MLYLAIGATQEKLCCSWWVERRLVTQEVTGTLLYLIICPQADVPAPHLQDSSLLKEAAAVKVEEACSDLSG